MRAPAPYRGGFTLVEVMVAMAILVTVLSSVVLLYTGAVRTTLNGYANIDNREIGRTVLNAMERDLETAFTAREYGKFYQFHGTPNGFSYVGVLPNGQLGRVSYVMNRLDDEYDYQSNFVIGFRLMLERAIQQASAGATNPPQAGIDFARKLVVGLITDETLPALTLDAYDNAVTQGLADLAAQQSGGSDLFWRLGTLQAVDTSGTLVSFEDYPVEMIVNVETTYLLRLEEPGVSDLTSFDLPPNPLDPSVRMQFPQIDAGDIDNTFTNYPAQGWYGGNCIYGTGSVENTGGGQDLLWCALYNALLSPTPGALDDNDLRTLADGTSLALASTAPSHFLSNETVRAIVDARKRDLWLEMLAGEDYMNLMDPFVNRVPLILGASATGARNWFEAWSNDDVLGVANIQNNRDPKDYAVGERIVSAARPILYNVTDPLFAQELYNFDVMGVDGYFIYGDTDEEFQQTYNSADNIPGYTRFIDPTATVDPGDPLSPVMTAIDRVNEFDYQLGDEMRGLRTRASTGSPMAPALPKMVGPRFWIMAEGKTTGSPDFREYFDQIIEVPSGATRKLPTQFVANTN